MSDIAKRLLLTLASGAYLASPIDLIPDFIPLFGLADDTAFLLLALYSWYAMYRKRKIDETAAGQTIIDVEPAEVDIP
jgi:uncharacterized membrane protein YkvA (DUF1232 family)